MNTKSLFSISSLLANSPITIAIADSNQKVINGIEHIVEKFDGGIVISTFTNGYQLLKYCQNNNLPDVFIISYELDVIDGIQTTTILKRLYPEVKIMIISEYTTLTALTTSISAGALGFVPKNMVDEYNKNVNKDLHKYNFHLAIKRVTNGDYYFSKMLFQNQTITPELLNSRTIATISLKELKTVTQELKLTEKEITVLLMYCTNLTKLQITELISISLKTLDNHITHISRKINTNCTKDMLMQLYRLGIVQTAKYNKYNELEAVYEQTV